MPLVDYCEVCEVCGKQVYKQSLSNEQIIAHYYRSRAAGGKTTLKRLAKQFGVNYGSLRKYKTRYDRAGKWGSKAALKRAATADAIWKAMEG